MDDDTLAGSPGPEAEFEPLIPDTDRDIMNDPAFNPPHRTDTNTSKPASEAGSSSLDTCRICRSEGSPEEPLFYPCKCSGSIKFVHQECLMEWLSHSRKKHCELCKTPFKFTKLYDADMPQTLPWRVFVKKACIHVLLTGLQWLRALFVACVWLLFLPWLVRWGWRWTFWIADAGWAREVMMHKMKRQYAAGVAHERQSNETSSYTEVVEKYFADLSGMSKATNSTPGGPLIYGWASELMDSMTRKKVDAPETVLVNATNGGSSQQWPSLEDSSLFSDWSYISHMTDSPRFNRLMLDIFEGQVITCVVIAGFLLVFLIREWVVQQQPLAHLAEANQQMIQQAENMQAEHTQQLRDREQQLQDQLRLLDEAQRQLQAWEDDNITNSAETQEVDMVLGGVSDSDFIGWEALGALVEEVTGRLRNNDDGGRGFRTGAADVIKQSVPAQRAGVDSTEFSDWIFARLTAMNSHDRNEWQTVIVVEMRRLARLEAHPASSVDGQTTGSASPPRPGFPNDSADSNDRPSMPDRDTSSRATEIQRLLEEAESALSTGGDRDATARRLAEARAELQERSAASAQLKQAIDQATAAAKDHTSRSASLDPLPITNAGPEARLNIKRVGKGEIRPVPEPHDREVIVIKHTDLGLADHNTDAADDDDVWQDDSTDAGEDGDEALGTEEPERPDGELQELQEEIQQEEDTFSNRVASVFREEFGLDEAEELEDLRQAGIGPDGNNLPTTAPADPEAARQTQLAPELPRGYVGRLLDWFWGDIKLDSPGEPTPNTVNEELVNANGDAAHQGPFVPMQDGQPVLHQDHQPPAPPEAAHNHDHQGPDPEVLAAAQQAGLDAEAIEDAEDIEGILELIGMQGPMIALAQTSAFCTVLVCGTVLAAVGLPYMGGKLVLSIIGSPVDFALKLPFQIISFVADVLIDGTLFVGGSVIVATTILGTQASRALHWAVPMLMPLGVATIFGKVTDAAAVSSNAAISRLERLFTTPAGGLGGSLGLGVHWIFLQASMHSHASLNNLEEEIRWVFRTAGQTVYALAETAATGSPSMAWARLHPVLSVLPSLPLKLLDYLDGIWQPFWQSLRTTGSLTLTFRSAATPLDPALVWWSSHDRFSAIVVGYMTLAVIATIYVAWNRPITSSPSGQRTEQLIRDTLRQAGGVLKVILIISIEMLAFPLYCGILLDVALLPLFAGSSLATRLSFAASSPYSFCFVHWFAGTCYMFHFALFVGMCRRILRKGTIWFIRDPDDPTFHPVRDVLERGIATQLRKIGFSALVYGALVILCLGGVIWSIGKVFEGVFPVRWISTEPIIEFPMDLLLYNFCTPIVFRLYKPSELVHVMYSWWLRKVARWLRLSHFLFDDRRIDEERIASSLSWRGALKGTPDTSETGSANAKSEGKFVFTPCSDQYRPPKPREAFLHYTLDDVYIGDAAGKKHEHFAAVYIPPSFRTRIAAFMVCLWAFSAVLGLSATIVPLCVGRSMLAAAFGKEIQLGVNDVHAFSLGAYSLFGIGLSLAKSKAGVDAVKDRISHLDLAPFKRLAMQILRCTYVYGFVGIVMPIFAVLILQFYLVLPVHTYVSMGTDASANLASNGTTPASPLISAAANLTTDSLANLTSPAAAKPASEDPVFHTIHLLQDYALGALYMRLAARLVFTAPASRWAEAFRRITANGYANPSIKLFTRYVMLPTLLLSSIALLFPPAMAKLGLAALPSMMPVDWVQKLGLADATVRTMVYRYCFPTCAGLAGAWIVAKEVQRLTFKWRASIRDEVYLVGERLHNFGEKKPPVGSKGIMRKV